MLFKNPNILYALLLLLIPIIIHLVRWKKYKKVLFTNLAFLEELEIKSRKSRKLKELVILITRLLAFTFLILAFAQPYLPSKAEKEKSGKIKEIIFLDNTLSMSAPMDKQNIFNQNKADLINYIKDDENYSFFTNNDFYPDLTGDQLKKIIQDLDFSPEISRHIEQLKKINLNTINLEKKDITPHIIYITDLQKLRNKPLTKYLFPNENRYFFKINNNPDLINISIDSLSYNGKSNGQLHYKVWLSSNVNQGKIPLSVLQNNLILWNGTADFQSKRHIEIEFSIPVQNEIAAKIILDDKGFPFDNELFFTYKQPKKIKVLLVGDKIPDFIKKIYTPDEFILNKQADNEINYAALKNYQLIIIYQNDLKKLDWESLKNYIENYGNLALIPSLKTAENAENFANVLQKLSIPIHSQIIDTQKVLLNKINFSHPFFKNVFLKKVENFAYPFVKKHIRLKIGSHTLYQLNDQTSFVQVFQNKGKIYVFNSDLSKEQTNFTKAAYLVVPLFYQMAKDFENGQKPYFLLGEDSSWKVPVQTEKEKLLKLKIDNEILIPYQVKQPNNVMLTAGKNLKKAGIYTIEYQGKIIEKVAFNYSRKENRLNFYKIPDLPNLNKINSISEYYQLKKEYSHEKSLWKYFIFLAFVFLMIEFLILKFWK